jgi:hypothetical protein
MSVCMVVQGYKGILPQAHFRSYSAVRQMPELNPASAVKERHQCQHLS